MVFGMIKLPLYTTKGTNAVTNTNDVMHLQIIF